jgi:hypothetical protein
VVAEAMGEGEEVGVGEAAGFGVAGDPQEQTRIAAINRGRFIGQP